MKGKILRALREAGQEYVSGSSLCEKLGVSRQAVWKNIVALKEMGYEFAAGSNKGYRLISAPDRLYGPEIESHLPEDGICQRVECLDRVDSTNSYAKRLAEQGEPEGVLVVAERQTAGRGRRGRHWESPEGVNVFMTLILRPKLHPSMISGMTLLAALAIAKAIQEMVSVDVAIKWPNDVIVAGKKVCGILTEMSSEENFVHYGVVGMGINVNQSGFPEELQGKATSLFLETGKKLDRCALAARTVTLFGAYYRQYEREGNLSAIVAEYNQLLANRDREVRVYYGMVEDAAEEDVRTGIARGIDREGALLVEMDGREERIVSGEVSVRGKDGYV